MNRGYLKHVFCNLHCILILLMQWCINQCGLLCKYSGTQSLRVLTTLVDSFAFTVTYLRNIFRSWLTKIIWPVVCMQIEGKTGSSYFEFCAGQRHPRLYVEQSRHSHIMTTIQKWIFEGFILGLNTIVHVILQLLPNSISLNPHL